MRRFKFMSSACIGVVLVAGCSKPDAPMEPGPSQSPGVAVLEASAPEAVPQEIPTESSLSLKRGRLTLLTQRATFRPCGQTSEFWVIDQSDGAYREAFANEPKPIELYVEAHGERAVVPASMPEARSYPGAFILEEVLYAMTEGEGQGCGQPAPTYTVAARGNEPFWAIDVSEDKMIWRQPDDPKELVIEAVESQDVEGTVGYAGTEQGHTLELFVEAQSCRDSMSGAFFAYSARATFDGKELKGCARVGE